MMINRQEKTLQGRKYSPAYSVVFFITVIIMLQLLSGCKVAKVSDDGQDDQSLSQVNVRLKWLHQAQFAGNYVAKEKGFYEREGLLVNLLPFDFVHAPIDEVENGNADFGITGADELLVAKDAGKAAHVKAIAVIYKKNPVCLYSLAESGITKPQHFINKTIGIQRTTDGRDVNVGILYYSMMRKLGINRSLVREVTVGFDVSDLISGTTDVSTGYATNEPHQLISAGKDVNIIMVSDYGVDMYADVIIANDELLINRPEIAKAFLRATMAGWQYSFENEAEAVDIVLKYNALSSRSHEDYMLRKSVPFINTCESILGFMEDHEWENAQEILLEQKVIQSRIGMDELYTNDFLTEMNQCVG